MLEKWLFNTRPIRPSLSVCVTPLDIIIIIIIIIINIMMDTVALRTLSSILEDGNMSVSTTGVQKHVPASKHQQKNIWIRDLFVCLERNIAWSDAYSPFKAVMPHANVPCRPLT